MQFRTQNAALNCIQKIVARILTAGAGWRGVEKVPEIVFAKSSVFVNTPGMTATAPKTAASVPVAILVRVSTLKQETDRQVSELREYANRKGYTVVEVCAEQVTGSAE